jgi:hypothetical protein
MPIVLITLRGAVGERGIMALPIRQGAGTDARPGMGPDSGTFVGETTTADFDCPVGSRVMRALPMTRS